MILVSGGVKGGVGKTTVATNLAILCQHSGRKVILVDADEQRSASEFAEQRAALGNGNLPCRKASGGKETLSVIQDLAEEYDDVIVDVGGRDTQAQRAALLVADIALLPFPAGNFDAWTLPQVERLISEVRQDNKTLDAIAFLSRGYHNGPDNQEATDMLRASTVLRFLDAPLMERRVYVRTAGDGLSVAETKGSQHSKARSEILRLYEAIFNPQTAATAA
jgi:chromosome partitioning protein